MRAKSSDSPQTLAESKRPLGLIGALLLVALVEVWVGRQKLITMEPSPASWRWSVNQARALARNAEVLCLGSSLVKFGVLPSVVEARSGCPTRNLAVYGGRIASSYYLLKRALDSGAKPRIVLVDCHDGPILATSSGELNESVASNRRNWPEILSASECVELGWNAGSAEFTASLLLMKLLPTLKSRFELRNHVLASLEGDSELTQTRLMALLRNWKLNQGTQVMPAAEAPPAASAEDLVVARGDAPGLPPGQYLSNTLMDTYADRFMELSKAHGITVCWLMPPMTPAVMSGQRLTGFERFYTGFGVRLQRAFPNLVILDGRRLGFGNECFTDQTHLNADGGVAFSASIGEAVGKILAGKAPDSHWVDLARVATEPNSTPIENFGQSYLAIKAALDKR